MRIAIWYEIDTGKYQGYIRCDLTNVEPNNVQIDNVEGLDRLNKVKNEENETGNRDIIDVIGRAAGFGGQMQIQVTLNGSDIESVRVLSSMESDEIGKPALEEMCRRIIEANGTEVDFVSGASFSSKAICKAVNRALEQSR